MRRRNPRDEFQQNRKFERDESEKFNRQRQERQEKARSFLPDPEVLENYNYVVEGSAERIIALIEAEQKHRHKFELNQQKYVAAAQILGIFAVMLIAYAIIAAAIYLGTNGQFYLAVALCIAGFAYLGGAVLINFRQTKRHGGGRDNHGRDFRRHRNDRGGGRHHHNNQNQQNQQNQQQTQPTGNAR